jgi:hypothetical protein
MKADELDKLLSFIYENKSRLVRFASWIATIGTLVLCLVYGVMTISDSRDDHFKYGENACVYKGENTSQYFWHDKGYKPVNMVGECNGTGVLIRGFDLGLHAARISCGCQARRHRCQNECAQAGDCCSQVAQADRGQAGRGRGALNPHGARSRKGPGSA